MDRRTQDARAERELRRKRASRTGPASGVPSTHPGGEAPPVGPGFAVTPPAWTVSPGATERAPAVVPAVCFAVPAPARLAPPAARPGRGRHEAPARHQFLRNHGRVVPGTRRF